MQRRGAFLKGFAALALLLTAAAVPSGAAEDKDEALEERIGHWIDALAFDPDYYFNERGVTPPISVVPSGYNGTGWAYAIDLPYLRLVRPIKPQPATPFEPKNFSELQARLGSYLQWMEADLFSCPGAMKMLRKFGDDWYPLPFTEDQLKQPPKSDDDIIVSTDGNFITIRTNPMWNGIRDRYSVSRMRTPNDWALRMLKVVEPCLKPSATPPPWQRKISDPGNLLRHPEEDE